MIFNNNLKKSNTMNFNNNRNNPFIQSMNMNQNPNQLAFSTMNNMNNNIISTNINTQANPDGTITEIKTLILRNGGSVTTKTIYDQNQNIIHKETLDQNNANNPNNNVQRTVDTFGNITETRTNILPNGGSTISKITRDRNGNVIGQSSGTFGNNNANTFMSTSFNTGNFNNNNFNNNMQTIVQTNYNMPNNFNMGMNNLFSSMNMMMNNMNNMNHMLMRNVNNMNNMFTNNMNSMFMNNMNNINNMLMNNIPNMNYMNNMNNMGNMNQGIEPSLLNNLNVTIIKDVSRLDKEKDHCVICLGNFKNGDEVIYLPCLHVFHKDCLLEWFKGHNFCPICKFKMTYENLNSK